MSINGAHVQLGEDGEIIGPMLIEGESLTHTCAGRVDLFLESIESPESGHFYPGQVATSASTPHQAPTFYVKKDVSGGKLFITSIRIIYARAPIPSKSNPYLPVEEVAAPIIPPSTPFTLNIPLEKITDTKTVKRWLFGHPYFEGIVHSVPNGGLPEKNIVRFYFPYASDEAMVFHARMLMEKKKMESRPVFGVDLPRYQHESNIPAYAFAEAEAHINQGGIGESYRPPAL